MTHAAKVLVCLSWVLVVLSSFYWYSMGQMSGRHDLVMEQVEESQCGTKGGYISLRTHQCVFPPRVPQ
jgi:hypothetical protein